MIINPIFLLRNQNNLIKKIGNKRIIWIMYYLKFLWRLKTILMRITMNEKIFNKKRIYIKRNKTHLKFTHIPKISIIQQDHQIYLMQNFPQNNIYKQQSSSQKLYLQQMEMLLQHPPFFQIQQISLLQYLLLNVVTYRLNISKKY